MNKNIFSKESISKLKDAFEIFDKNKEGHITLKELKDLMKVIGYNLSEGELQTIIDEADGDVSGRLDFKEFLGLMSRKMRDYDAEEELIEIFRMFDVNGLGMITKKEMKIVVGDKISEEEIDEIFKEGGINGCINYEDFVRMIIN